MRVLVACEFSGVVRRAFAALGHDAWSCDLLPASDASSNHVQGDVLDVLGDGWDLMVAHPPCTYLCSSGMHWTTRGLRDPKLTALAVEFVLELWNAPIPRVCIENPVGILSRQIGPPAQIVQPWQFGHDASKATCLWLRGLAPLEHGRIVPPRGWRLAGLPSSGQQRVIGGYRFERASATAPSRPVWANQTPSGQNKLGPSAKRWAERSTTYEGIARAMATQWGGR